MGRALVGRSMVEEDGGVKWDKDTRPLPQRVLVERLSKAHRSRVSINCHIWQFGLKSDISRCCRYKLDNTPHAPMISAHHSCSPTTTIFLPNDLAAYSNTPTSWDPIW